jgi:hypothetical protein
MNIRRIRFPGTTKGKSMTIHFRTFCTVLALAGAMADTRAQLACGNTDSWAETNLNKYMIPDEFPFDASITKSAAPAFYNGYLLAEPKCRGIGTANWAPSCLEHDKCMEAIGMNGKSSTTCNNDVLAGWKKTCQREYGYTYSELMAMNTGDWSALGAQMSARTQNKGWCLKTCEDMAQVAYEIMKKGTSSFEVAGRIFADVNGNGSLDAVYFPKTNRMYVDLDRKNQPVRYTPPIPVWTPNFYKVGDFNGDGRKDMAMMIQNTDYIHPHWGNADGTFSVGHFSPWKSYAIGAPTNYQVGDFNHDRIDDLIHFAPGADYTHIWYGNRDGTFTVGYFKPWAKYAVDANRILVGDFDGDGYWDDFVDVIPGYVNVWRGNDNGTFDIGTWIPWNGYALGTAKDYDVLDLNNDGKDDLFHRAHSWKWGGKPGFHQVGFDMAKITTEEMKVWLSQPRRQ